MKARGIEPIVKPRSSRADTGHEARRRAVRLYRELGVKHGLGLSSIVSDGWLKQHSQHLKGYLGNTAY